MNRSHGQEGTEADRRKLAQAQHRMFRSVRQQIPVPNPPKLVLTVPPSLRRQDPSLAGFLQEEKMETGRFQCRPGSGEITSLFEPADCDDNILGRSVPNNTAATLGTSSEMHRPAKCRAMRVSAFCLYRLRLPPSRPDIATQWAGPGRSRSSIQMPARARSKLPPDAGGASLANGSGPARTRRFACQRIVKVARPGPAAAAGIRASEAHPSHPPFADSEEAAGSSCARGGNALGRGTAGTLPGPRPDSAARKPAGGAPKRCAHAKFCVTTPRPPAAV